MECFYFNAPNGSHLPNLINYSIDKAKPNYYVQYFKRHFNWSISNEVQLDIHQIFLTKVKYVTDMNVVINCTNRTLVGP